MVRKIRISVQQLVWYQGETDADQPEIYDRLLQTLINDWRGNFGGRFFTGIHSALPNMRT